MADASTQFFEGLGSRGHEAHLEGANGTLRIELTNGKKTERWLVSVDDGDVAVSHRNDTADSTLRTRRDLFDGIARGEVNAMAAVLRGALAVEGDWELIVLFQRLFPGPPVANGATAR